MLKSALPQIQKRVARSFLLCILALASLLNINNNAFANTYSIQVDASQADKQFLSIEILFNNLPKTKSLTFNQKSQYKIQKLEIYNGNRKLNFKVNKNDIEFENKIGGQIHIKYRLSIKKNKLTKHYAYINTNFCILNGNAFIMPNQINGIRTIDLRFKLPTQWRSFSTLPLLQKNHYQINDDKKKHSQASILNQLKTNGILLGRFESRIQKIGLTQVRVNLFHAWDKDYKKRIAKMSFSLYKHFQRNYKLKLKQYDINWTPLTKNKHKIEGPVWLNGSILSMPTKVKRHYPLLAYRMALPISYFSAYGRQYGLKKDQWFHISLPTYLKQKALSAIKTKSKSNKNVWNRLYAHYQKQTKNHSANTHDKKHALHRTYVINPIKIKLLELHLKQRSKKTLQAYIKYRYNQRLNGKQAYNLQADLEKYFSLSLQPFWDYWINSNHYLLPLWKNLASKKTTPIFKLTGTPISNNYFNYLSKHHARYFHQVIEILNDEKSRILLAKRQKASFKIIPTLFLKNLNTLKSKTHWQFHQSLIVTTRSQRRLRQPSIQTVNNAGKLISTLLIKEKTYLNKISKSPIRKVWFSVKNNIKQNKKRINRRIVNKETLILSGKQNFTVNLLWRSAGYKIAIEYWFNNKQVSNPTVQTIPITQSYSRLNSKLVGFAKAGIFTVIIKANGETLAKRSILYLPK